MDGWVIEKTGEIVIHVGRSHVDDGLFALVGYKMVSKNKVSGVNGGVLCLVGCSIAMSSSFRIFLCDRSLSSLISRRAVMGNLMRSETLSWSRGGVVARTYAILLMMHDDLLQSDESARLARSGSVNLTKDGQVSTGQRRSPAVGDKAICTHPKVPSPSLPWSS